MIAQRKRVTSGGTNDYLYVPRLVASFAGAPGKYRGGDFGVLNRFDRSSPMAGEAEVKYLDGDFRVLRPGAFVRCAVTGTPIPLEELKYWSVDLQEAYVSPEVVLQRHFPNQAKR
jgi:hypothetical protein